MMHGAESRYSRQSRFAPLGEEGQRRIGSSHVAVVGCGALERSRRTCWHGPGVGRLRLIDRDFVEWSNLQRKCFSRRRTLPSPPKSRRWGSPTGTGKFVDCDRAGGGRSHSANALDLLETVDLIRGWH